MKKKIDSRVDTFYIMLIREDYSRTLRHYQRRITPNYNNHVNRIIDCCTPSTLIYLLLLILLVVRHPNSTEYSLRVQGSAFFFRVCSKTIKKPHKYSCNQTENKRLLLLLLLFSYVSGSSTTHGSC